MPTLREIMKQIVHQRPRRKYLIGKRVCNTARSRLQKKLENEVWVES